MTDTRTAERIAKLEEWKRTHEKLTESIIQDLSELEDRQDKDEQFRHWILGIFVVIAFLAGIFSNTLSSILVNALTAGG